MAFDPFNDDKSDLQRDILEVHDLNPNMEPKHIADKLDCSTSYVRKTLNEYRSRGSLW